MLKNYLVITMIVFLLVGCGQAPSTTGGAMMETSTAAPATTAAAATTAGPVATAGTTEKVTLGLGYIPNVQFAPFYVAAARGYYAAEGLQVEFSYGGNVNDLLLQTGTGKLPFVMASGDEVLLARSQGVPVKMAFLLYQRMPIAVFSQASAGIEKPADLRGKTIGLPGRFGATYIGLRGLLHAEGIKEEEVTLNEIGFTQFEAVQAGSVPAAVGYANNEPLRLQESGVDVNVINVADYIQLVNNGVVINETYARDNAETVRRFIRATRRGLEATIKDPEAAFQDSLAQIPELAPDQQPFQRKVLAETIGYWRTADTDREGLGWPNPAAWRATYDFLRDSGILAQETNPDDAYALEFFK